MLDPDPARHFVRPDLDPKMFDADGIPERFFRKKVDFENKTRSAYDKKYAKLPMMHHAKS